MKKLIYIIVLLTVCNVSAQHEMMLQASRAQFSNEGGGGSLPADIIVTYPLSGQYPINDFQEWYFFPSAKGNKITLTVNSIDTEGCCDKIIVTEFANITINSKTPILQTYAGSSIETSIGFRVIFTSDGGINGNGFTFTISETADGSLPLASLTHPVIGDYNPEDFQIWYFQDGQISFSAFSTESGSDLVRIYEVNGNVQPTLINTYSGTSIPSDYSNTKRYLMIFTSDAGLQSTGFSLTFTPN